MNRERNVEGVTYWPYRITFRMADGRRVRWVRWSPAGGYFVREELIRELVARGIEPEHLKDGSCTIRVAS